MDLTYLQDSFGVRGKWCMNKTRQHFTALLYASIPFSGKITHLISYLTSKSQRFLQLYNYHITTQCTTVAWMFSNFDSPERWSQTPQPVYCTCCFRSCWWDHVDHNWDVRALCLEIIVKTTFFNCSFSVVVIITCDNFFHQNSQYKVMIGSIS